MKKAESALLFLVLLFLPTQLGKHFWPDFAFVYSLPIDYLSPTAYFWDILAVLLFAVFLWRRGHINPLALNLLFFFILTQGISLLGSNNLGAGLVRLEQYLIAGFFGVYIASAKFKVHGAKWALGISLLAEALLATGQFIKGGSLGFWILGERSFALSTPGIAKFDFYGLEFLRPYGTFPHPNVLAAFMIIVAMLLPRALTFIPAAVTVFLTVSRTAIVAGIVAALWRLNKKLRILFLILIAVLLPILYTRFSAAFNFDILTLVRREEQTLIAFRLWLDHPLFGVGLNNFIPQASDQLLAGPSRFLQPVHNIFLLALAETGLVGLSGLLILIGFPIYMLFKLNPIPYTLYPILSIWLVIIFLGLFDHYFLTLPQGYRLLFLVWGISISMLEWKE